MKSKFVLVGANGIIQVESNMGVSKVVVSIDKGKTFDYSDNVKNYGSCR